jgi:putative membrane protein
MTHQQATIKNKYIMKKQNYLFAFLLGSIFMLGLSACSKDDDDNYNMTNAEFVTKASSSNMFEIAAGQLAVNKGVNANVKAFGAHMVTDHTKAAQEMAALASKKGLTVPSDMLPAQQEMYNAMKDLTGAAFDKQFAATMVTSHQQTISLFEQAGDESGVPDADLRGFASGKLPTLREHLQDAQTLQTDVNND